MNIKGIGIDINDSTISGSIDKLDRELGYFSECGFDVVELTVPGLFFIVNGKLERKRVLNIKKILDNYDFKYTLHLPDNMNLGVMDEIEINKEIFSSCIEFASMISAKMLVYHTGMNYLSIANRYETSEIEKRKRFEVIVLSELSFIAEKNGISIGIENLDPSDNEEKIISENPELKANIRLFHPGLFLMELLKEVEAVGRKNVGITLDLSHFFLASILTGEDFTSSIKKISSKIFHLHINDNFGKLKNKKRPDFYEALYGEGDLHLPPGWGNVPLRKLRSLLKNYSGYVILEISPFYRDNLSEASEWVKKYFMEEV